MSWCLQGHDCGRWPRSRCPWATEQTTQQHPPRQRPTQEGMMTSLIAYTTRVVPHRAGPESFIRSGSATSPRLLSLSPSHDLDDIGGRLHPHVPSHDGPTPSELVVPTPPPRPLSE